jgi:hypothetical protein
LVTACTSRVLLAGLVSNMPGVPSSYLNHQSHWAALTTLDGTMFMRQTILVLALYLSHPSTYELLTRPGLL